EVHALDVASGRRQFKTRDVAWSMAVADGRIHTATVALPAHSAHSFRYLAAGDYWFDDEHADAHDGTNSRIHT
ncbi:hypothetical protein ACWCO4_35960, partial [Streptomyces virginiae]